MARPRSLWQAPAFDPWSRASDLWSSLGACNLPAHLPRELRPCRSVAQLVEHRSPKPRVGGSNPSAPANVALIRTPLWFCLSGQALNCGVRIPPLLPRWSPDPNPLCLYLSGQALRFFGSRQFGLTASCLHRGGKGLPAGRRPRRYEIADKGFAAIRSLSLLLWLGIFVRPGRVFCDMPPIEHEN